MITAGFTLIGRGNWTGGETYLRNTLGVIGKSVADRLRIKLFLSPEQAEKVGDRFDGILADPPYVDPVFATAGRGGGLTKAIVTGSDKAMERAMRDAGVDAVFESGAFYGRNFGLPTVAWMPDFQHRHLPHLFSKFLWWRRDIGFRTQVRNNRLIMLSSENAQKDCETFYPSSKGSTAVVRFAIDFDPVRHVARHAEMVEKYELPDRFFYLPNQFWKHKNHGVVLDALSLLKQRGELDAIPPIVLTGLPKDPRDPGYFDSLMERVKSEELDSHFRYLGLIPYDDVFGLAGTCDALINPSLFEGWSTTVEEAKGLGAPLILSNIEIHREQKPDATFFDPAKPEALANILSDFAKAERPARPEIATLLSDQDIRVKAHGEALYNAFDAAIKRWPHK